MKKAKKPKLLRTEFLGARLKAFRFLAKHSLRRVESILKVSDDTLWRIEHGLNVSYETGKIVEEYLRENGV